MRPVRVLIVDDSVVFRMLLSDLLASDTGIIVAGVAGNGRQALRGSQIKRDVSHSTLTCQGWMEWKPWLRSANSMRSCR